MEPGQSPPEDLCGRWFPRGGTVVSPLAGGGASGAETWLVRHEGGTLVLKNFVGSGGGRHAAWVHRLMRHVGSAGVRSVPRVMIASDGTTLQADWAGRLWELVEWMPGDATMAPTPAQVVAAAESLARVHLAAASLAGEPTRVDQSPGIAHRIERARDLLAHPWSVRDGSHGPPDIRPRLARAASTFAAADGVVAMSRLAALRSRPLGLQPVLRDVWSDHVLFVGRDVSGIIDWHAAGVDTPAIDVARLLGSWPEEPALTDRFLGAYAAVRGLGDEEAALVSVLKDAGIVFGLDNWFRWTIDEHRTFRDRERVLGRIDSLVAALPGALQRLAGSDRSSD